MLGRGTLERQGGMMTGGVSADQQPNNRWFNPQTQKYVDPSDYKYGSPEQYTALYGLNIQNPEGMDVPLGSYYDYKTKQIKSHKGNPYAYRVIAANNAWKNAGIDDLKLSDEEYAKLTEEEKQANFEARQAAAASDPMNFGGVDGTSPLVMIRLHTTWAFIRLRTMKKKTLSYVRCLTKVKLLRLSLTVT